MSISSSHLTKQVSKYYLVWTINIRPKTFHAFLQYPKNEVKFDSSKTIASTIVFIVNLLKNWRWQGNAANLRGRNFDAWPPLRTETNEVSMCHQDFVDLGLQIIANFNSVITWLTALQINQLRSQSYKIYKFLFGMLKILSFHVCNTWT